MSRLGFGSAALRAAASAAGDLRDLRLWRVGAVSRQEGVRPAGAERGWPRLDHRHAGDSLEGRHLRRRHRRGDVRVLVDPRRARPPRDDGNGRVAGHLDVRRVGRVDGISGLLHGIRWRRRCHAPARVTRRLRRMDPTPPATATSSTWDCRTSGSGPGSVRTCSISLRWPRDPRFSSNASRVEHHDELEAIIVRAFADKTAQQVVDRLDAAQIANARMNTVSEFLDHPQLAARGKWRQVDSPVGPLRALVPPFGFDDVEPRMGPIPGGRRAHGQDID